jgi:hypothetical protein
MMSAHPKGGVLIELSIVVSKKSTDGQAAAPAASSAAGRDMSAGWVMVPWADLKAGTSTLTLTGGLPWAHQKIQPEDCGSKKKFFGLSKSQPSVSSITLRLDAAGEAAHFPDKCVCHKNAVPLLQVFFNEYSCHFILFVLIQCSCFRFFCDRKFQAFWDNHQPCATQCSTTCF